MAPKTAYDAFLDKELTSKYPSRPNMYECPTYTWKFD
jgi:hypothetical protein